MCELKTECERVKWSRRYGVAMRRYLRQGQSRNLQPAARLGRQAAPLGLEALDIARVHELALRTVTSPENQVGNAGQERLDRADSFFKETIVPIEATHRAARQAEVCIDRLKRTLRRRVAESTASDEQLERAIARRETVEASADALAVRHDKLLTEAQRIQKRLRNRMHEVLSQQEGERKRFSGELRNETAQALLAIDINLLALKSSGQVNAEETEKSLADARRILEKSGTRRRMSGTG